MLDTKSTCKHTLLPNACYFVSTCNLFSFFSLFFFASVWHHNNFILHQDIIYRAMTQRCCLDWTLLLTCVSTQWFYFSSRRIVVHIHVPWTPFRKPRLPVSWIPCCHGSIKCFAILKQKPITVESVAQVFSPGYRWLLLSQTIIFVSLAHSS